MMMQTKILRLSAVLCVLLALAGCRLLPNRLPTTATAQSQPAANETATPAESIATGENPAGLLNALIADRVNAVNNGDQQLYLSTVLPGDSVLRKEEANLIRAASSLEITDYTLAASDIEQAEDGLTAVLQQSYKLDGKLHQCEFRAVFKTENGKLYYGGPDFEILENGHVRVCHLPGGESLAVALLQAESDALAQMERHLGFTPEGFITIKLFDDQQVFLQSIKLDLPEWVGGWHEYGEAIKSFTGAYGSNAANYKPMLNHESTHRMVSELSNDNASYWLQEGLAGVLEDWLDNPDGEYLQPHEASMEYTPFAQHKSIDLEKIGMEDPGAVGLYYATSKAYAAFLMDQFGWAKMREALEYMKKHELIPVTGAEKIIETNSRTDEAFKAVFGIADDTGMQSTFDQWLKELLH